MTVIYNLQMAIITAENFCQLQQESEYLLDWPTNGQTLFLIVNIYLFMVG